MKKRDKSFLGKLREEATQVILDRDHKVPPKVMFKGVHLTSICSSWGKPKVIKVQTGDHHNSLDKEVYFRTKFDLYRSEDKFYLHKLGESDYDQYRTFFMVISFDSPKDLKVIIEDTADRRLHASRPLIELLVSALDSPWLTEDERNEWESLFVVGEC